MRVKLNGNTQTVADGLSLTALLTQLEIKPQNLAIEYNGEVLTQDADWQELTIKDGDILEVLRFVGGG